MLSIFPTAYFGNIEYFKHLNDSKDLLIESKEHIIKGTIRSRCEILGPNGIQQLNIPIVRADGSKTPVDNVKISFDTDWQKNHWRSIKTAYSSAPFFDHYGIEVEELIFQEEKNLVQFNQTIIERISEWLSLDLKLKYSNEYIKSGNIQDYRLSAFDHLQEILPYHQVFAEELEFVPNLSILDVVFNEGPMARNWIVTS